jgi:hypothetical protein
MRWLNATSQSKSGPPNPRWRRSCAPCQLQLPKSNCSHPKKASHPGRLVCFTTTTAAGSLAAAGSGAGIDRIAGSGRLKSHWDGCWCHNVSRTQQTGDRPLRTFVTTAANVFFEPNLLVCCPATNVRYRKSEKVIAKITAKEAIQHTAECYSAGSLMPIYACRAASLPTAKAARRVS